MMALNNRKYWDLRMKNSQKLAGKNINAKMKKLYKTAYKHIDAELNKLWLEMVTSGEISASNLFKANRYRDLRNAIDAELNALAGKNNNFVQESLMDTYISAWNDMSGFIGVSKEFTVLHREVAKQIIHQNYKGATFSDRIWDNMSELRSKLHDSVILSAVAGEDVRKVAKKLQKELNSSYSDSKRITITETSRVFNEACRTNALESGQFSTYTLLLEASACPACVDLEGIHFPLTKSILPVHPHCKCTMLIDV